MNKKASIEWLVIGYHDLKSAQLLFEVNHYTDSIGNDLQQSIEKILKSILAYQNLKILKTHNLYEIYDSIKYKLELQDNELVMLEKATEYFIEDRYPNPNYCLPEKGEIKEMLEFAEELFDRVCNILDIDKSDVTK